MDRANVVIIGGGVVGCAIARELSARCSDVFLLEKLPRLGMATSTRNSGVIHSGIYYAPGSWKARHCLRGNRLTYEFCAAHGVPHRKSGKLVIASSPAEREKLDALLQNGRTNGVEGLRIIDQDAIHSREPNIKGVQAIEVPSTGIVSSEDLVKAYARVAKNQGANLVTHAGVERLDALSDCVRVTSAAGEIETLCLVNSAGLFADDVALMLGSKMAQHRIYPVRGEYCEFVPSQRGIVRGLVYPLPHPEGMSLGLHLTKTLAGNVLLGPTARYIDDKNDYERDRIPVEEFVLSAKLLLPNLTPEDLLPAYSGIRPKLAPPSKESSSSPERKGISDFIIECDPEFPRVVHLMGIDSPGLTSAPAIAEHVGSLVSQILG
jgi:glycerol-3-phosphate dehydrogenase